MSVKKSFNIVDVYYWVLLCNVLCAICCLVFNVKEAQPFFPVIVKTLPSLKWNPSANLWSPRIEFLSKMEPKQLKGNPRMVNPFGFHPNISGTTQKILSRAGLEQLHYRCIGKHDKQIFASLCAKWVTMLRPVPVRFYCHGYTTFFLGAPRPLIQSPRPGFLINCLNNHPREILFPGGFTNMKAVVIKNMLLE